HCLVLPSRESWRSRRSSLERRSPSSKRAGEILFTRPRRVFPTGLSVTPFSLRHGPAPPVGPQTPFPLPCTKRVEEKTLFLALTRSTLIKVRRLKTLADKASTENHFGGHTSCAVIRVLGSSSHVGRTLRPDFSGMSQAPA